MLQTLSPAKTYFIGNREFRFNKPYVMGILNVTPDSFSDGGKYFNKNTAVNYALGMLKDGADIIDIGGESTRPGSDPVSEEEELKRVIPVIEEILKQKPDAILSVDTTKSRVARQALQSGVKMVNDISGLTFDPAIADTAAEFNAALVIMHIKGTPKTMQLNPDYKNLMDEIYEFLYNQANKASKAGVKKIIIDPGIGFGKRTEDNFEIIKKLGNLTRLGYPILIGVSRKSFLGKIFDLDVNERDTITAVTETIAILNGAGIIRTHNVKNGVNICKLLHKHSDIYSNSGQLISEQ
jgi:dihydropteroate synthase